MHKGIEHIGKEAECTLARVESQSKVTEVKDQLKLAIEEERYEDAAKLRDALLQLTKESEESHVH
jgi:protein-arginine kinase activator protein McsA